MVIFVAWLDSISVEQAFEILDFPFQILNVLDGGQSAIRLIVGTCWVVSILLL